MNQQYILVTGGLGYIGSHTVVELVKEKDENVLIVDNLDNTNIKCLERLKEITGKPDKILFIELDIKNH
jgi:UDP-glucose 4-epimerase